MERPGKRARSDRCIIEVSDALELPDVHCWCNQGFMNWMAAKHTHPDLWIWSRECPDVVLFSMTRPL